MEYRFELVIEDSKAEDNIKVFDFVARTFDEVYEYMKGLDSEAVIIAVCRREVISKIITKAE